MDQPDGIQEHQRTRNIRAKFTLPLCCFGTGSQIDAELTINSNEHESKVVEESSTTTKPVADDGEKQQQPATTHDDNKQQATDS
jgi:hypothetical protein